MRFERLWAVFYARNLEFFRDRSALGWNFIFPFLIVLGFGVIFSGKGFKEYRIGIFPHPSGIVSLDRVEIPAGFKEIPYAEFIGIHSLEEGLEKLRHHRIDFLLETGLAPHRYWIDDSSPKAYAIEGVFKGSLSPADVETLVQKEEIQGKKIRYIDWFFPGILSMNMMFSALWGVGYIVVRYRKNGVLKRLHATPLTALEYLLAQILSRLFLLIFTLTVVWIGCNLFFSFTVEGSYLDLFIVFAVGGLSMCALGLLLASRGSSEEFTDGVLNFITWPMMFLSEVWFSIDSAPEWIKLASKALPLTHMVEAARKVMNDGVGLSEVALELTVLISIAVVCLVTGAALFSWRK